MIHTIYRITCDCCNKVEFNEGDETELEVLENAQRHKWTTRSMPNGSEWDLCPKCSMIAPEDIP